MHHFRAQIAHNQHYHGEMAVSGISEAEIMQQVVSLQICDISAIPGTINAT
jgi:hypothetical protein